MPRSLATVLCGLCAVATSAWAGLGERQIEVDAVRQSQAARSSPAGAPYTALSYELASGTRVQAWRAPDGSIFAVGWDGPFLPDLRRLLGPHFGLLERQAPAGAGPAAHVLVGDGTAIVESSGRLGAFSGRAWLPALLPAGLDPRALP